MPCNYEEETTPAGITKLVDALKANLLTGTDGIRAVSRKIELNNL